MECTIYTLLICPLFKMLLEHKHAIGDVCFCTLRDIFVIFFMVRTVTRSYVAVMNIRFGIHPISETNVHAEGGEGRKRRRRILKAFLPRRGVELIILSNSVPSTEYSNVQTSCLLQASQVTMMKQFI